MLQLSSSASSDCVISVLRTGNGRDSGVFFLLLLWLILFLWVSGSSCSTQLPIFPEPAPSSPSQPLDSGFCSFIIAPFSNYSCTEYQVTTSDGFILSVQNIVRAGIEGAADSFKAVLFLHYGLIGGDIWFYNPYPTPLATADKGFSVWIGHFRTTRWAFGHYSLKPSQKEYWDWCMDELANYDFQTLAEFVHHKNLKRPFHLVGYSEGARVGIGAISYYSKAARIFKSATLLAPVIYLRHVRAPTVIGLSLSGLGLVGYNAGAGRFSFFGFENLFPPQINATQIKSQLIASLTGRSCCIDPTTVYSVLTGPFSYTSYKSIAHLTQSMQRGNFQAYDYGSKETNARVYGNIVPPSYNLKGVPSSIPLLTVYGGSDDLATPVDVKTFTMNLSTTPKLIYLKYYSHADFAFSKSVNQDINQPLLRFILSHS